MRNATQREIVGFNLVAHGQLREPGDQTPMAADHALEQPLMSEAIEPALLAVTGRRGKHQREAAGVAFFEEAALQREDQLVRRANADETRDAHGVAVTYNGGGLVGGNDLVLERHRPIAARRAIWQSRSRAEPGTCRRRIGPRVRPAKR